MSVVGESGMFISLLNFFLLKITGPIVVPFLHSHSKQFIKVIDASKEIICLYKFVMGSFKFYGF